MTIRFAAVGLDHRHVYGQVACLIDAGAACVGYASGTSGGDPHVLEGFAERFPQVPAVDDAQRLLDDPSIDLIVSAAIPDARAPLGIAAMRRGKDFMSDKPGFASLDQLDAAEAAQRETGRIYSVCFSERFEVPAVARAQALVADGAIGTVVQTVGLGPHRLNRHMRPDWFFDAARYGGIVNDIASHQIDQFLVFTGATEVEIAASTVANFATPDAPRFEDFGEVLLRAPGASGYIRVDWYTPDGLATWGDGRLTILGTEGFIELRKYVDIAGRPGTDHLFLVNGEETRHIDCADEPLSYGARLIADVRDRTETAMSQAHCFRTSRLALEAQDRATRLGHPA